MHWGRADNEWQLVGDFLPLLGWGLGSGEQMGGERQLEQDLVHYAEECNRRDNILH